MTINAGAHWCAAKRCHTNVPLSRLMCTKHWKHVPYSIQKRIWDTYVPGQDITGASENYLQAVRDAIAAVEEKEAA